MTVTLTQLNEWLMAAENEQLEFKAARNNFHFEKLVRYCAALANEGGGSIVLGVTDKRPRLVIGTRAFEQLQRTKAGLIEKLRIRIETAELEHPDGRVLVFTTPARPIGVPVAVDGAYWMRAGEDLAPMTPDLLRRIFDESGPDFSAEICRGATLADLDSSAIEEFRRRWYAKARLEGLKQLSAEQLLRDADLLSEEGICYAALILLGTRRALTKYLAQAEVIFEYRSSEAAGPANHREEFREGFLLFYDRLWDLINLRNDKQHYQDGLFMLDIPTFSEGAVREAVLNGMSHRDYRHAGSVFVRQFNRRVEIVSPGGFPAGVTADNILYRQNPRNRKLADSLSRCGLVERAGQGADRIFEECVRQSKPLPDFSQTDAYQVSLNLRGEVQDPAFVRFLETVGREQQVSFSTQDFLALDLVYRDHQVPTVLRGALARLVELGVVESIGRGRGTRYLLARRFYALTGKLGAYTRRRGLDRNANKALLLRHIVESGENGSRLEELQQVLPALSRDQLQTLLRELKREGEIVSKGVTKAARWYSVAD